MPAILAISSAHRAKGQTICSWEKPILSGWNRTQYGIRPLRIRNSMKISIDPHAASGNISARKYAS